MKKPKHALQFDALESRTFLSVGLGSPSHAVTIERTTPIKPVRPVVETGTIAGTFSLASQTIAGAGKSAPVVGAVTLSGSTAGIVGTSGSHISGVVTLTSVSDPTVKENLLLTGTVPSSTRRPITVRVTVVGGTGTFATDTGSGTGTIRLSNITTTGGSFNFTFRTTLKTG